MRDDLRSFWLGVFIGVKVMEDEEGLRNFFRVEDVGECDDER